MARANQTQMFPDEWRASTSLAGVYALRMLGMFLVLPVLSLYAAGLPGAEGNAALAGFETTVLIDLTVAVHPQSLPDLVKEWNKADLRVRRTEG